MVSSNIFSEQVLSMVQGNIIPLLSTDLGPKLILYVDDIVDVSYFIMFYNFPYVEMCWHNWWHPRQCSAPFKCDASVQEPKFYCNHKCIVCVCNMEMQFTYVHARWEGSVNHPRCWMKRLVTQSIDSHGH